MGDQFNLLQWFYEATELNPKLVVQLCIHFLIGYAGAWTNFFIDHFRVVGINMTLKSYKGKWFFLVNRCFIGGVVSLLFAPLGNYKTAFLAGFTAFALLEQYLPGVNQRISVERFLKKLEDQFTSESGSRFDKNMSKTLIEAKKGNELDEKEGYQK